jgi:phosphoacetylglucosamine mutase
MHLPTKLPPEASPEKLLQLLQEHPPGDTFLNYGTAGFRFDASILPPIMVRVGIVATLRSWQKQAPVGVMVTASHNDESYNGVKLADPDGGMMASDGETLAVEMANERDTNRLLQKIEHFKMKSDFIPTIHLGRDTRKHSPALCDLVVQTARAMGSAILDHGIITTPMLHHAVLHGNREYLPLLIPPRPGVAGYFSLLAHSYHALLATLSSPGDRRAPLVVDAACGVGYTHAQTLHQAIQDLDPTHRPLLVVNASGSGPLNEKCGSEHVQKALQPPTFYDATADLPTQYCASLDGDADRIVFFNVIDGQMRLQDGDKIACLLCRFLQAEYQALQADAPSLPTIRLGVVQTAYANGASTQYLEQVLGPEGIVIAKTGVKYVHHAAAEHFDVGVYFEANGHGTVLFGPAFYNCMAQADAALRGKRCRGSVALQRLSVLPALVNQAVGDALSDLLLVDAILQIQGWSPSVWDAIYTDLPSRQGKVLVKDRNMIQTNENETKCLSPTQVQEELEIAMAEVKGRAFIRPSGTEDVVRVYAEAPTRALADQLATKAAGIVFRLCNGIGEAPVFG